MYKLEPGRRLAGGTPDTPVRAETSCRSSSSTGIWGQVGRSVGGFKGKLGCPCGPMFVGPVVHTTPGELVAVTAFINRRSARLGDSLC